jgi:hypothetical protein
MKVRAADRAFLVRDSSEDLQVVRSEGSYLYDERGRKYIDFLTGWNVGNIGWGRREIKAAIKRFKGPEYVYPYYLYKPWTELAQLLADITPGRKSGETFIGALPKRTASLQRSEMFIGTSAEKNCLAPEERNVYRYVCRKELPRSRGAKRSLMRRRSINISSLRDEETVVSLGSPENELSVRTCDKLKCVGQQETFLCL